MDERRSGLRSLVELLVVAAILGLIYLTVVTGEPIRMLRGWIDSLGGGRVLTERLVQAIPVIVGLAVVFLAVQALRSYLELRARRPSTRRKPLPPAPIPRPVHPTRPIRRPDPAPDEDGAYAPLPPRVEPIYEAVATPAPVAPAPVAPAPVAPAPVAPAPVAMSRAADPIPVSDPVDFEQVEPSPFIQVSTSAEAPVPAVEGPRFFDQHQKVRRQVDEWLDGDLTDHPVRLLAEWCMERVAGAGLNGVVLRRVEREEARFVLSFAPDGVDGSSQELMRVTQLSDDFRQLGARCDIAVERNNRVVLTFEKLRPAMFTAEVRNRSLDESHALPLLVPVGKARRREVWLNLAAYEKTLITGDNRASAVDLIRSLTFTVAAYAHPRFLRIAVIDQHLMDDFDGIPHRAFASFDGPATLAAVRQEVLDRARHLTQVRLPSATVYNVQARLRIPALLLVISDLAQLGSRDLANLVNQQLLARTGVYVLAAAPGSPREALETLQGYFPGRIVTSMSNMELAKRLTSSKLALQLRPNEGILAQAGYAIGNETVQLNINPPRVINDALQLMRDQERLANPFEGALPVPITGSDGDEMGMADDGETGLDGLLPEPSAATAAPTESDDDAPALFERAPERPVEREAGFTPDERSLHVTLEELVEQTPFREPDAPVEPVLGLPEEEPPVEQVAPSDDGLTADERFEQDLFASLPPVPADVPGAADLPDHMRAALEMTLRFGSISGPRMRKEVLPAHAARDINLNVMQVLYFSQILDMTLPIHAAKRPLIVSDRVEAYRKFVEAYQRFERDPGFVRGEVKKMWGASGIPDPDRIDDPDPGTSGAADSDIDLTPADDPTPSSAGDIDMTPSEEALPGPASVSEDIPLELERLLDVALASGFASALILQQTAPDVDPDRISKLYFPALVASGVLAAEMNGRPISPTSLIVPRPIAITDREQALARLAEVWPQIRLRVEGR